MPDVTELMAWEDGELSDDETIALFQRLVDSGMAWQLQGVYGRAARDMICAGLVHDTHHVLSLSEKTQEEHMRRCPACSAAASL